MILSFLNISCFFFIFIFIYIVVLGLSCGTWGLQSLLWYVGFHSPTRDWNPGPLHWKGRVLATGLSGKSDNDSLH